MQQCASQDACPSVHLPCQELSRSNQTCKDQVLVKYTGGKMKYTLKYFHNVLNKKAYYFIPDLIMQVNKSI